MIAENSVHTVGYTNKPRLRGLLELVGGEIVLSQALPIEQQLWKDIAAIARFRIDRVLHFQKAVLSQSLLDSILLEYRKSDTHRSLEPFLLVVSC